MARKLVEVIVDGRVILVYPVALASLNTQTSDNDYIKEARLNMRDDGYNADVINRATFNVLDE